VRRFLRGWRKRYPFPVEWVDDRANKQLRRAEDAWMAQFAGATALKRRQVAAVVAWHGASPFGLGAGGVDVDTPAHVRRCVRAALAANGADEALERLVGAGGVAGWEPSLASAVLAACRPDLYAVGDKGTLRALEALGLLVRRDHHAALGPLDWWPYQRECRRLAEVSDLSLRQVAQALRAGSDRAPALPTAPMR